MQQQWASITHVYRAYTVNYSISASVSCTISVRSTNSISNIRSTASAHQQHISRRTISVSTGTTGG
jgi:hypothetical protein